MKKQIMCILALMTIGSVPSNLAMTSAKPSTIKTASPEIKAKYADLYKIAGDNARFIYKAFYLLAKQQKNLNERLDTGLIVFDSGDYYKCRSFASTAMRNHKIMTYQQIMDLLRQMYPEYAN